MAVETWAQVRTYMDHSWDVPDDHFTEDVLCHWNGFRGCLTEDERSTLNTEVMGLNTNQAFGLTDAGKVSLGAIGRSISPALGNVMSFHL